jgi:hypothetical protein
LGSTKAEHDPLIVPGKRHIWREIAEADEPREVGPADTFPLSEYSKGKARPVSGAAWPLTSRNTA